MRKANSKLWIDWSEVERSFTLWQRKIYAEKSETDYWSFMNYFE